MPEEKPPEADPMLRDRLTEEETKKIQQWFDTNAGAHSKCPICGTNEWAAIEHLVSPIILGGPRRNGWEMGSGVYPHFMMSCQKCGNVQFINAINAGVVEREKRVPPPREKK
jgi:hypothetical protein